MVAASDTPEQYTALGLPEFYVSRELKDYKKYLVVFLFDDLEKEVSSEALKLAEPLIIYNLNEYNVIDFVLQNKSTLVVNEEGQNVVYKLKEHYPTDVISYEPTMSYRQHREAVNGFLQVFHRIFLFHYQLKP